MLTEVLPTQGINWTSIINTLLMIMAPVLLELGTGILRGASKWLQAHAGKSNFLKFTAEVAQIMSASWQEEAGALKKDAEDGKITPEEWAAHKTRLKENATKKALERLQAYPKEHAEEFGAHVSDYIESWLDQNSKVQSILKAVAEKTEIKADDVKKAEDAVAKQNPENIIKG